MAVRFKVGNRLQLASWRDARLLNAPQRAGALLMMDISIIVRRLPVLQKAEHVEPVTEVLALVVC